MPGECPRCGARLLKRTGKSKKNNKQYTFYTCEKGKDDCGFSTFDVPTAENCPECGKTMFKKSGKGAHKGFCTNEECGLFVPEDKRGGWVKKAKDADGDSGSEATSAAKTKKPSPMTKRTVKAKSTGMRKAPAKKAK
jgi:DNA topoisomerase-1